MKKRTMRRRKRSSRKKRGPELYLEGQEEKENEKELRHMNLDEEKEKNE